MGVRTTRAGDVSRGVGPCIEALEKRRLLSAGDPDPSWGVGGTLPITPPGTDRGTSYSAYRILHAPDGKLLIAGQVTHPVGGTPDQQGNIFVARLTSAGQFDQTFGDSGIVEIVDPAFAGNQVESLLVQPDHKVLIGIYDGTLTRLSATGQVDTSFGNRGTIQTRPGSKAIVAPDGKILVASGGSDRIDDPFPVHMVITRYLPTGALDRSFGGGDGIFTQFQGYAEGIVVQPDGKIVVAGVTTQSVWEEGEDDAIGVGRLRPDGTPDPTFGGGDGFVIVDLGAEGDIVPTAAIDPAGRIVVGAAQVDSHTFSPFRLKPDGSLDRLFQTISFGRSIDPRFTSIDSHGKIVFSGFAQDGDNGDGTGLIGFEFSARFTSSGQLDRTYAGGLGYRNIVGVPDLLPDGAVISVASEPFETISIRRYSNDDASPDLSGVRLGSDGTLSVTGTAGDDALTVRPWRDFVLAEANEIVRAFPIPAAKRVVIRAGAGNDTVLAPGLHVPLKIFGEDGNDYLQGGFGITLIDGGRGDDVIGDLWDLTGFPDLTFASRTLRGGDGNDLIFGGTADDRIDGGKGADQLFGGDGVDTIDYGSRTAGVTVDLTNLGYENGGTGEGDYISGDFENVIGSAGDDVIRGNAANNIIYGNAGDDRIEGLAGNDLLVGGPGRDRLYGGSGADRLFARDGGNADFVDGGAGIDSVARDDKDAVLSIEKFI